MTGKSLKRNNLIFRLISRVMYREHKPTSTSRLIHSSFSTSDRVKLFVCPVEIYFCYPHSVKKINCRSFFEKNLEDVEHIISGQPIFLNRKHALRYSRFMGHAQSILKAYVEDSAIESSSQELYLRRGALNKELIHGCYPLNRVGKRFVVNPWFNQRLLVQ